MTMLLLGFFAILKIKILIKLIFDNGSKDSIVETILNIYISNVSTVNL